MVPVARGINSSGWTYDIIRMIKQYDNTFADIYAFNFSDEQAAASNLRIFAHDRQEYFLIRLSEMIPNQNQIDNG